MNKEVVAPRSGNSKSSLAWPISFAAILFIAGLTVLLFLVFYGVDDKLLMEQVPTTHVVESVNTEPAWQGYDKEGNSIDVMPPKNCKVYRGEYVMSKRFKGSWVLTRYLADHPLKEGECPKNTLFLVRRSELKKWTSQYKQIARDEADKAYLIRVQK